MNHWFRLYNTLVDDPKVQQLPEPLFKALVNLWCVASQNDGVLPGNADIAYKLRVKPEKSAEYVSKLVRAGLLDNIDGVFVPHNWTGRQFQSDTSTERVKKHRDKKRNVPSSVSGNVPETANGTDRTEQSKANTDQNTAEARPLDEIGLKEETALRLLFTATRSGLHLPVPNMDHIKVWLADGVGKGTISAAVTPILAKKADMASLAYCDAVVREKHAKSLSVPPLEPVPLTDDDWRVAAKRFKGNRSLWLRHAGPEPGMAGCRCPVHVLVDAMIDPATGYDISTSWHFITEGTVEMAAFVHDAQTRKARPPKVYELEIDGITKRGFYSALAIPSGYDEATGERLQPASEDAA